MRSGLAPLLQVDVVPGRRSHQVGPVDEDVLIRGPRGIQSPSRAPLRGIRVSHEGRRCIGIWSAASNSVYKDGCMGNLSILQWARLLEHGGGLTRASCILGVAGMASCPRYSCLFALASRVFVGSSSFIIGSGLVSDFGFWIEGPNRERGTMISAPSGLKACKAS